MQPIIKNIKCFNKLVIINIKNTTAGNISKLFI